MGRYLAVNIGSTSSKLAIYENEAEIKSESISHPKEELAKFNLILEQYEYREKIINDFVTSNGFTYEDFDVIVTRGGGIRAVQGGIIKINEAYIEDVISLKYGSHPLMCAALILYKLHKEKGIPVIVVDSATTSELCDDAKYTGIKGIYRKSRMHALNQKSTARKYAASIGKKYEDLRLVVAHLGGGISISAHEYGFAVDTNNTLDGDGPMSPERAGSIPSEALIDVCYSNKYSKKEVMSMICGKGGLISHLGTSNALEIEEKINNGDENAREVYHAMAYQIAKEIGTMATVLKGSVDAVLMTGSLSYSKMLTGWIKEYVSYIAPIVVYPGENEMEALALGAHRYFTKKEAAREYTKEDLYD